MPGLVTYPEEYSHDVISQAWKMLGVVGTKQTQLLNSYKTERDKYVLRYY